MPLQNATKIGPLSKSCAQNGIRFMLFLAFSTFDEKKRDGVGKTSFFIKKTWLNPIRRGAKKWENWIKIE